ncbi:hypothetical protein HMPREF9136_2284 [Prevotella dentalis DSM 3688]|uniref:Uncharacterized protein n=1 Tax=Prevotella dentalis (strain ATCC 49559 / DSM 3688 / JCM 13448 / NCTC 12043 / ES 2772) TaxID=908937 RepID=F9D606_PREDD|nr:hypothetical protein HMPREF9136_2284 [Prevotella dentalis DSM 3688]
MGLPLLAVPHRLVFTGKHQRGANAHPMRGGQTFLMDGLRA